MVQITIGTEKDINMQLHLTLTPPSPITLPLGYHHILQAIVYKLIGSRDNNLHDQGASYGERSYKLFTFGELCGHYSIKNGRITFDSSISWEIRSLDEGIIDSIAENLDEGISFGPVHVSDISYEVFDNHVEDYDIVIRMVSPICVRKTDEITGSEVYYNPDDIDFYRMVEDNFIRKYASCFGEYPQEKIVLSGLKTCPKDRVITKFKGSYIEAYGGVYRLVGRPEYLDFLYQTGLGSRNSQGFGMFEIIE